MFYRNAIQRRIETCMSILLSEEAHVDEKHLALYEFFLRKRELFTKEHTKILKCQCKFKIESIYTLQSQTTVEFVLLFTLFIENHGKMLHTEGCLPCQCIFEDGNIVQLYVSEHQWDKERLVDLQNVLPRKDDVLCWNKHELQREPNPERGGYDALNAVKYAERYWNEYNPNYPRFENDCTNYISQCLFAGGAKMVGTSRTEGWWIRGDVWSYSWTTAHALYLFLITNRVGLRAKVVNDVKQLLLGDVICYDFEGDGRINHTTIVVSKTPDGEPLVNAHTYNSRNRPWRYLDSSAYTNQIQYKFLQIYL